MARFNMKESENYGVGKSNYFTLKDDRQVGRIRFLYNNMNDVLGVSCHEVTVGDKKIDVECLRNYNDPIDKCPLCNAEYRIKAQLFIPVYDIDAKESKIWTRGKTFFDRLSGLCSRYNPLVSVPIEVERHGKAGDTNTTYELFPGVPDNAKISDFPTIEIENNAFLVKTYEQMENYLMTGSFDVEARPARTDYNRQSNQPVRRRPAYNSEDSF